MAKKKRRSTVHYVTFCYRDGATVACLAERKPSERVLKDRGERVDSDFVFRENAVELDESYEWTPDYRGRASDILSNRINMRRAIRELVLPELSLIQESLAKIDQRLDKIEGQQNNSRRK